MTLNVLWRSSVGADSIPNYQDLLDSDVHITVETDKDAAKGKLQGVQVLVDGRPDETLLDGPDLEHVVVPYVGINDDLREQMMARPHLKLYNSHFNDAYVAQHAVALLLACSNRIAQADGPMHKGDWTARYDGDLKSVFLPGKTCLLLGYGAIGRELRGRLEGLGMRVTALRQHPSPDRNIQEYGPDRLNDALAEADAIIISLPATPDTKGLLGKTAFEAMKQDIIIVNVGRGEVVDQHALYASLTTGKVFSAGLDVWWNYPENKGARKNTEPADAPLHDLPNVVMSPHRAAQYQDWGVTSFKDVAKTLNAIAKGESRNSVDPAKGY